MALDTHQDDCAYDAPRKDLYEIGEMPPLGYVPAKMYAWAIRASATASRTPRCRSKSWKPRKIDSNEVLVLVMAAGVNYNGVWAGLGQPISPVRRAQGALPHRRAPTRRASSGRSATRSSAGRSATRS